MINANCEILPGFHLLVDIPNRYLKPSGDQRLKMQQGNIKILDTFEHELVTVVEVQDGLIILSGCGHNGVLNMVAATQNALPDKPILALIGGFHLLHEDQETVQKVAETLMALDIRAVYSGHCTGDKAVAILSEVLGERFHPLYTGLVLQF